MIWALGLFAPFLVFVALIDFRMKTKRRALRTAQVESKQRDDTLPGATPEVPEIVTKPAPIVDDTNSVFDDLRCAMEGDSENLFVPLEVALVELVRVGRSLKVYTLNLT